MVAECSIIQRDISELKDGDEMMLVSEIFGGKYRKSLGLLLFFFLHVCHFYKCKY